jgi:hypothetical protein
MNEIYLYLISGLTCFYFASLFDFIGDTLIHHKQNVFNKIKHTKLHYYFNIDEDWWKRKYDEQGERKCWQVFGAKIKKPAFIFDGWHGFKILRKWMIANMAFCFILPTIIHLNICLLISAYTLTLVMFGLIESINCATWYRKWLRN